MAFPSIHKLLAFGGPLRGLENWSCTLRFSTNGFDGDQAAEQNACDAYRDALLAWATTNQAMVAADAQLAFVKWNSIGTDGRYSHPYTVLTENDPPVAFGIGTSPHVNQVACVVTLQTDQARGLASKGRIFMPAPKGTLSSDGRLATTLTQSYAQSMAELLNTLNGLVTGSRVVVASRVGAGAQHPVTSVAVGRVLDTMRSRRTSLAEERTAVALAAVP